MTEQEAEVFAARLTRIWEPKWVEDIGTKEWKHYFTECVYYAGLEENVCLEVDETQGVHFSLKFYRNYDCLASVTAHPDGQVEVDEKVKCLTAQWLPFFRRCCWLSGCDIEAAAHEKVEWMQGFSREELESW